MINAALLNPSRNVRKHRSDLLLSASIVILLVVSLVVMYSISPILSQKVTGDVNRNYFLYRQLFHVSTGLIIFLVISRISWYRWRNFLPGLIIACGFSLLLLLIPATNITENGATRWVGFSNFSYQPAELIKLTVILFLAKRISSSTPELLNNPKTGLWPVILLLAVVAVPIVLFQRDMGTMLVIAGVIIGLFFLSGVSIKRVGQLLLVGTMFGVFSILLFPHRMVRVMTFLNPADTANAANYHINQALLAIGSGGLFGLGLGKSIQIYGYLPEAANDSIFAILAETFGLVGSVVIIGLLSFLTYRCILVARNAPDKFGQMIAIGVALWLGIQSLVNIMAMLGLIPLTGIPLPFLSYGGTNLLITMIGLGIVANISKYTVKEIHANSVIGRRHGRPHYANLSYR